MLSPFVWGRNGEALTPDQVAALRELADAQRGKMGDTSPVGHWTAGAARVVDALGGVLKERRADKAEAAGMASADSYVADNPVLSSLIGGQSATPGNAMAPGTLTGDSRYRDAIASIESAGSGDYAAIGPTHPTLGRALGRYQIMEANLPEWSQAALGRQVSAEEFMANPDIQDAIFDHQFGGYVEKYGPEGAAQAWLGGPGGVGQVDRKDSLGTSIGDYGARFTKALGGSYGQPPQQDAGVIAALAKAAADPWVQKKYGPVIDALMGNEMKRQNAQYEQQLAQSDPAYQLGLQKSQLELDAMRNPPAPKPIEVGGVLLDPVTMEPLFDSRTPVDTPRPMMPEERATWGIPADDARPYALVDGKPTLIGGSGVTVNNNLDGGQTPFSKKLDENFAADANIWLQGGAAGVEKKMSQLDEAMTILESGQNVTGAIGMLPESVRPFFNAQGTIAQENVAEVVQSSLRETLGAQFTEKEGERLIARAFNPKLPPAENAKRVRRLIEQTRKMAAAKQAMVDYAMENGTLRGYAGPRPDMSSLSDLMASPDEMDAFQGGGAPSGSGAPTVSPEDQANPAYQAFISDPSVIAAAKKYGVTPDEMWATKNGGGQ